MYHVITIVINSVFRQGTDFYIKIVGEFNHIIISRFKYMSNWSIFLILVI